MTSWTTFFFQPAGAFSISFIAYTHGRLHSAQGVSSAGMYTVAGRSRLLVARQRFVDTLMNDGEPCRESASGGNYQYALGRPDFSGMCRADRGEIGHHA